MNTCRLPRSGSLLGPFARAGFRLIEWVPGSFWTWDIPRLIHLLVYTVAALWDQVRSSTEIREMGPLLISSWRSIRDITRKGPFLARAVDDGAFFGVFGLPIRFERPSQITERMAEITASLGCFGIHDDRDGSFQAFREGGVRVEDREPETLARVYGVPHETALGILEAWCEGWAFIVVQRPMGPLVYGNHDGISENPTDEVSRANWLVVEPEILDEAPDREMLDVRPIDLVQLTRWGYSLYDDPRDDISPETAVIMADAEPWIRLDLIGAYVTALAGYPILCEETYSELCHEIETESLTLWVFHELADLIGEESEVLRETWEMLDDGAKAELWQSACQHAPFPCWVDHGELHVDFPSILPHIIDALDGLPIHLDGSERSAGAHSIIESL